MGLAELERPLVVLAELELAEEELVLAGAPGLALVLDLATGCSMLRHCSPLFLLQSFQSE